MSHQYHSVTSRKWALFRKKQWVKELVDILSNFLLGLVREAIPVVPAFTEAREAPAKTSKMEVGGKLYHSHVNVSGRVTRCKVAGVECSNGVML